MEFLRKPQSVWLRRALFQVHLWLGLLAGLYLVVVCVTGSALVFRIDLQRATFPHLFTPSTGGPPADALTIMERVRDAYPGWQLSGLDAPTTARPTSLAYVSKGSQFLTILIDPISARVLGELPERSWVRTLQDLHFDLLAGRTGRVVNGIGAALLLAMCVTGMVIWWPGLANWRRAFTVDFSRSWKRINWDLHSALGIWTLPLIAMWAITGLYFAFPAGFRQVVNQVSPLTVTRAPRSVAPEGGVPLDWGTLLDRARQDAAAAHIARVVVPSTPDAAFLVMFTGEVPTPAGTTSLESIYLDQYTGVRLEAPPGGGRSVGDVVMAWMAPLHVGNFGGVGVKVAWLVFGLVPPVLFVTGFLMWWVRVVRPLRARPVATRPAEARP